MKGISFFPTIAVGLMLTIALLAAANSSPHIRTAALNPSPQHVICCNLPYNVRGEWIGSSRHCREELEKAPPAVRAKVCSQIRDAGGCVEAGPVCDKYDPDHCEPAKGALCQAVGQGKRLVKEARASVGSADIYSSLQTGLGPLLEKIKNELCDYPDAQARVDALKKALDELNYTSGQSNLQNNLRLIRLEEGLQNLAYDKCDVSRPTEGTSNPCSPGSKPKTAGDDEALKFIIKQFEKAAKTVAKGPKGIEQYKQTRKYFDQMQAAQCLPENVIEAMRQVVNDRNVSSYSENCPTLCSAIGDWYGSLLGKNKGIEKKFLVEKCLADCN